MSSRIEIVECIKHQGKRAEPFEIKLLIFDVGVIRCQLDRRVEILGYLFGYQCLGLLDMFLSKEKLAVEVADVYSVEVDNVNLAEA